MTATGVAALQALLEAENEAVYGYGLAGAQLSGDQLTAATRNWNLHREAQATVAAMITGRGGAPGSAAAAYQPPFTVTSASRACSLAGMLEDGLIRAYLGLVALNDATLRSFGAGEMQAAAIRAAYWRGGTTAFPGLDRAALGD